MGDAMKLNNSLIMITLAVILYINLIGFILPAGIFFAGSSFAGILFMGSLFAGSVLLLIRACGLSAYSVDGSRSGCAVDGSDGAIGLFPSRIGGLKNILYAAGMEKTDSNAGKEPGANRFEEAKNPGIEVTDEPDPRRLDDHTAESRASVRYWDADASIAPSVANGSPEQVKFHPGAHY